MLSATLRPCAPYAVFVASRSNLAGHAHSLAALHGLLCELSADRAQRFAERLQRRRDEFFLGAARNPIPGWPEFLVVDNRGELRPDLDDPRKIRRSFPAYKHAIDGGWNGDVRPRGMPIAGTGVRYGRHRRHPQTQHERRWACPVMEDGEPTVRGRRRFRHLPSSWDDVARTNQRSWKSQRQTQWCSGPRSSSRNQDTANRAVASPNHQPQDVPEGGRTPSKPNAGQNDRNPSPPAHPPAGQG